MKKEFPFFRFIWKTMEQKGHRKSMNILRNLILSEYPACEFVTHLEGIRIWKVEIEKTIGYWWIALNW